jgi:hypothetical protein
MSGRNGINKISYTLNTSDYNLDVYRLTESAVVMNATGTAQFDIIPEHVSSDETSLKPVNFIDWEKLDLPPLKINNSMQPEYPHFIFLNFYLDNSEPGHMPAGTILVYSPDGIVRFFDKNGTQFASYYDFRSLHSLGVPDKSVIKSPAGNVTAVDLDNQRIFTQIFETGGHG